MEQYKTDWRRWFTLKRIAIGLLLLAGCVIYKLTQVPQTPPTDVYATVRARVHLNDEINEICVTNMTTWTWPLADLRINNKYSVVSKDWEPLKERCFPPSEFRTSGGAVFSFGGKASSLQEFTIVIRPGEWNFTVMAWWIGTCSLRGVSDPRYPWYIKPYVICAPESNQ